MIIVVVDGGGQIGAFGAGLRNRSPVVSHLRLAMVGMLVFFTIAVIYQITAEGFQVRPSITAYCCTPVQAVFIGALVAVGMCMIAAPGMKQQRACGRRLGRPGFKRV